MRRRHVLIVGLSIALCAPFGLLVRVANAADEHWVATWAAAPQQPATGRGGRGGPAPNPGAPTPATAPAGAAAAAPSAAPAAAAAPATTVNAPPNTGYNNQTLRMFVRTSIGGLRARVHLSNAFGTTAVTIGAAHLALHTSTRLSTTGSVLTISDNATDSAIVPTSDRTLMFGGKPSIKIPPGASVLSDPVDFVVPALGDLAISVYVPGETGPATRHSMALRTAYVAAGDATGATELPDATTSTAWMFISGVDVLAPETSAAIVAFGDSITDGATSTPGTNRSWPSVLAERLQANTATRDLAVVNLGISGNRVLSDGAGVSALARFDRDVLSQGGARWLMILEGINDINGRAQNPITADDLIVAMKQMIERAHTHGIKVIGCTLTPAGAGTGPGEEMRAAVNDFIRKGGAFDAVVDFEAAVRDPDSAAPQFKPAFNNGDRLHPNDAGYKAMADAIDLSVFARK